MAEDKDNSQKTEQPTQKKIEESLKKGNIAYSREVTSFIMILLFSIVVILFLSDLFKNAVYKLAPLVTDIASYPADYTSSDVVEILFRILKDLAILILLPLFISVLGAFLGSFIQNGIIYAPEAPMPQLSRISPFSGLKRIFSKKSLVEFVKGIFKICLIAAIAWFAIRADLPKLDTIYDYSMIAAIALLGSMTSKMLIAICIALAFLSAVDWIYTKFAHLEDLKMTKEELKEEMKQSEGDPEIKARIRAVRNARARQRIAATVPKADVIITNPTHYSIALQYNPDEMHAPKVIAKGRDLMALRIREIAAEHNIPRVEQPEVARGLYRDCEEGEFITVEYYKAVAQILSKIKKRAA